MGKDLPLDLGNETIIAGTLPRGDQRDILFVKKITFSKISTNNTISIFHLPQDECIIFNCLLKIICHLKLRKLTLWILEATFQLDLKNFIEGKKMHLL